MRTIYKKELARIFKDKKMVFSVFLLPVLIMVGIMALVGNLTSRQMEDIENHESIVYMMNEPESFTAFLDASDLHMDVKSVETEAERDDVMSMPRHNNRLHAPFLHIHYEIYHTAKSPAVPCVDDFFFSQIAKSHPSSLLSPRPQQIGRQGS